MARNVFSQDHIKVALKEMADGLSLEETMKKYKVSKATLYRWKKQAQKQDDNEMNRLKKVDEENAKLKHLLAEAALEIQALKERLKGYL
jgi:putative transposase